MAKKPFIVYKSSAGSGKTFSLAKVFLSIVLENDDSRYFKNILALTFTVKAAAEMKARITSYLSDIASGENFQRKETPVMIESLIEELNIEKSVLAKRAGECLSAILHNYSDFSILTIDKFISRMIRAFASDLSLAPDFTIEIDHQLFIDKIESELFEEIGDNDELTTLVLQFLSRRMAQEQSGKIDETIRKTTLKTLTEEFYFIRKHLPRFSQQQLKALIEQLDAESKKIESRVSQIGIDALDLISKNGLDSSDLASGSKGVYSLFKKVSEGDFEKILMPTATIEKNVKNGVWKSAKGKDAVLEIEPHLKELYYALIHEKAGVERFNLIQAILKEIYSMAFISEVIRIGIKIREEENTRLLSDFNQIIADQFIAEQAPFVYERLGNRYNHLLIDEFQDTSLLQWQNLLPLLENSLSNGNKSLIVGDAKQSIYRFRGSEASLFSSLPNIDHPAESLLKGSYHEERLLTNFRSSQNVVSFNNRFFKHFCQLELSEDFSDVYSDLEQTTQSTEKGMVRWWFNPFKNKPKKEDALETMVNRIDALVHKEKVDQKDICCLFRTNDDAADLASRLLKIKGLNVISEESLLLKNNPQAQLVIATIRAQRYPNDPFILQSWLAKYHHVHQLNDYHLKASTLKKDKLNFNELLHSLLINLKFDESSDMFTRCYRITKSLAFSFTNPFILKLLDFCSEYEAQSKYLQEPFLDFFEKNEDKLSIALPEGKNAIRVMTIHKSKGLEFPVTLVFLPDIKKSKNTRETAWIQQNVEPLELALVRISDLQHTEYAPLYDEESAKSQLDFINVLYVAFTRAKIHLEIFSNESSEKTDKVAFIKQWNEWNETEYCLEIG